MEKFKTYGEYLDYLTAEIVRIYELVGSLRDSGELNEKDFYNTLRKLLDNAYTVARQLNRKVHENGRTDMEM